MDEYREHLSHRHTVRHTCVSHPRLVAGDIRLAQLLRAVLSLSRVQRLLGFIPSTTHFHCLISPVLVIPKSYARDTLCYHRIITPFLSATEMLLFFLLAVLALYCFPASSGAALSRPGWIFTPPVGGIPSITDLWCTLTGLLEAFQLSRRTTTKWGEP